MKKIFRKFTVVMIVVILGITMIPAAGFAATLGGVTLGETPLSFVETFDNWTSINQGYGGNSNGIFKHRYTNAKEIDRNQPAINRAVVTTADSLPYKGGNETYLDFRMQGGMYYTKQDGSSTGNILSTPRIYTDDKTSITNIVNEKLHISFEVKTDDMLKNKYVWYCGKWGDTTSRITSLLKMYTDGVMTIGLSGNSVTMPYKLGRWYKFDYVFDFGNNVCSSYVDGNKVYESTDGFSFIITNTNFFQFVIDGEAKEIPEGQSSGMGIDNLSISLHNASDEIIINKKQGLPSSEVGEPVVPEYEFGTAGSYTVKIPYTLFDLAQSGQIVVASYNPDGSLDRVSVGDSIASDTLSVGKVLCAEVDVSETANKIKIFLLDDMDNIVPIIPKIEISALK